MFTKCEGEWICCSLRTPAYYFNAAVSTVVNVCVQIISSSGKNSTVLYRFVEDRPWREVPLSSSVSIEIAREEEHAAGLQSVSSGLTKGFSYRQLCCEQLEQREVFRKLEKQNLIFFPLKNLRKENHQGWKRWLILRTILKIVTRLKTSEHCF